MLQSHKSPYWNCLKVQWWGRESFMHSLLQTAAMHVLQHSPHIAEVSWQGARRTSGHLSDCHLRVAVLPGTAGLYSLQKRLAGVNECQV